MNRRRGAWLLLALSVFLSTAGLAFLTVNRSLPTPSAAVALLYPVLAYLIVKAEPRNAIGWVFTVAGLSGAVTFAAGQYALTGLVTRPSTLPGPNLAGWVASWMWVPAIGTVGTLGLLLFPDGRLPGPRWRAVCVAAIAGLTLVSFGSAASPRAGVTGVHGPARLALQLTPWEPPPYAVARPLVIPGAQTMVAAGATLMLVAFVGSVLSLVIRYRYADDATRGQLGTVVLAVTGSSVIFVALVGSHRPLATTFAVVVIPVSVDAAIIRHRLFDIHVLINRTLVYGILTVLLATGHVISVLTLSWAIAPVSDGNDVAVAAATLLIAVAFSPLRRRVQLLVDKRFFRARYDALLITQEFSASVHDATDGYDLAAGLVDTIRRTLGPRTVSVLLRASWDETIDTARSPDP